MEFLIIKITSNYYIINFEKIYKYAILHIFQIISMRVFFATIRLEIFN